MQWIDPNEELPPQGKKILWFKAGDICVVQRYGDLWCPIPFFDSRFAATEKPELWAYIEPPHGFTGKTYIKPNGCKKPLDIDEIQMCYPVLYEQFIEGIKDLWGKDVGEENWIHSCEH
jgi:ABC-type uncharacterized transport system YnjBCD substrate-binding protein